MPLSVDFTTNQTIGAPSAINIVDTTTGSDITASTRWVIIQNALGEYVTENGTSTALAYTVWPIADGNDLTLDILSSDAALDITLRYVTSGGVTVAEDTQLQGFTLYAETFYYSLTQAQASQNQPPPMIIQDNGYYYQKMILRENIDDGNQAITYGGDITTAQNSYDRAAYQIQNQSDLF